jgi:hypothetical protein
LVERLNGKRINEETCRRKEDGGEMNHDDDFPMLYEGTSDACGTPVRGCIVALGIGR